MAIQIDLSASQFGIPFTGAYFRIGNVSVMRQRERYGEAKFSVVIDVLGYGTSAPTDDTQPVDTRRYHVALEDIEAQAGEKFLEKVYAWLMMQDSMSGAIAV